VLRALDALDPGLPLYGVPFAVKDNIDVAGLPTSAACPAFAYLPAADAPVVARLRAAGALVLGKTNLDQFATGLVGVRSPHGAPRCVFHSRLCLGRFQFGIGGCGGAGAGCLCAGHRYRRLRAGAGGLQPYCRDQADQGPAVDHGRGAGLPLARLRHHLCRKCRRGRAAAPHRAGL
jgi:hypothetical protein